MAISRQRQKDLRRIALSIAWQVLDAASTQIDFDTGCDELTMEENLFIGKVLDQKAQRAFIEYDDHRRRHAV